MAVEGDNPAPAGTAQPTAAPKSAAELFEAMEAEPGQSKPEDEEEEPEAEPHGEPEAEDEPEADEAEGEDSEAPEDEEAEADTEAKEPAAVEIDGKPIPLDEVKAGYLRQQDYTRKTQQLAEEKREFHSAVERVTSVDRDARQALEFAAKVVQAVLPPPPDPSLIQTDPVSFVQQKEAREQAMMVLRELEGRKEASVERETTASAEDIRRQREEQLRTLSEKVPAFAKPETRAKFREEAVQIGAKYYDLSPEEVDSIASWKEIAILRDAIEYRKLQSKTMSAVAKAKQAPKIVAKPGTRENPRPAKGLDALKKLGRAPTAREIFAALED
jgi:hypothetical protein